MKRFYYSLITLITITITLRAQLPDSVFVYGKNGVPIPKRPWRAAFETLGINVFVWSFNRFVTNEEFARVTPETILQNLKTGFVWDNDKFSTNLFAHPYHGGLYFNTARNNGLNFWQSLPYSFAGSLIWEFNGENEPAAINDFLATSVGGAAIGEVTNRMSHLILDNSKRGFDRAWREFLGLLISPMGGFNRLITGEMWKHRNTYFKYHDFHKIPVSFSIGMGDRYLTERNKFSKGEHIGYIELNLNYGDPFNKDRTDPYDYFNLNAVFSLGKKQPVISQINLTAKIWGKVIGNHFKGDLQFGIFQYFNYYDSDKFRKCSDKIPFRISEAASFGPGIIYKFPLLSHSLKLEQRIFTGAILLGGSLTDYYHIIDRDYNMGSGYSIKSNTLLDIMQHASLSFNIQHYHLFTWKGYEKKHFEQVNPLYLNVQGNKGNARLTVINTAIGINIIRNLKANIETSFYLRNSHYTYHKDVKYHTFESRIGLSMQF